VSEQKIPILYSFRRCPYAIRARMTLIYAQLIVELREVALKSKPHHMLDISPKGTVPVLQLPGGEVLDQSLQIMRWALMQRDVNNLLSDPVSHKLVLQNDFQFKDKLDRYKYSIGYPELSYEAHRENTLFYPQYLNSILASHRYLCGERMSVVDLAIFPFIRQYCFVDKGWFDDQPWPYLQQWLDDFLTTPEFAICMQKHPVWHEKGGVELFPGDD
jgi:glutathione S-transferase